MQKTLKEMEPSPASTLFLLPVNQFVETIKTECQSRLYVLMAKELKKA